MAYEPLHHKYRPQTFADLVGQEAIATTLTNALLSERIAPAYLFTGPRGTGKTSSARILAKSLNCMAGPKPTPTPCGVCETCRAIIRGSALDVIEIDAASNTGVDNIREIIERSQFSPVQCRFKVYVIDECLKGDSLVLTRNGLRRIDDVNIKDQEVLSYNETSSTWEYKKVLRWLERGEKETLIIKTSRSTICCTGNHLIRTDQGWLKAQNLTPGMKIVSPASVENGYQTCDNIQSLQWHTNFEIVESIIAGDIEKVYDIEVEDNHNFVANGLLVHNCHMLSTAAFNALLKTLEEPPESVIFVLATTDPQRVLPTIISRCQRFDYRRIPLASMVSHLRKIADLENIDIDQDAITLVAQLSNGGLRDAESLLDQLSLLSGTISPEKVWDLVGAVPEQDLLALLNAIASDNSEIVIDCCRQLMNRGREPLVVLQNLAAFYLNLLIAKNAPKRSDLIAVTSQTWELLCQMAPGWNVTTILMGQQKLKESEFQLRNSTQPRLWLEVTLLGLLPSAFQMVAADKTSNHSIAAPIPISLPPKNQTPTVIPPVEKTAIAPQETNISEMNPVEKNQGLSGEEVWEKILQELTPPSQALIRPHGILMHFDSRTAQIGIKSEPLLKIAKSKQPELEKAFEKICGQTIRVTLTSVIPDTSQSPSHPSPPTSQSPSPPSPPTSPPPSPPPPLSPPTSLSPRNGHQPPKPVTVSPPVPIVQPEEIPTSISDDDITKAAKQLVKAFDGEIVDLTPTEEEQNLIEEDAIAPSAPAIKPLIQGRPAIVDEDEDIPF